MEMFRKSEPSELLEQGFYTLDALPVAQAAASKHSEGYWFTIIL